MVVVDAAALAGAGLEDPRVILHGDVGELVKAAVAGHEVRRITTPRGSVFIKRIKGRDVAEIAHEWAMLCHLQEHRVPAPEPIALVEEPAAAALVTHGLPVVGTLEDAIVRNSGAISVETAARALPDLVRALHQAGVNHRDLYIGHVMVDSDGGLRLVDLGRAERRKRIPRHRLVKDLAALDFSTPERAVGDALRWRFLRTYMGKAAPRKRLIALARAIRRKSARMRRHAERKIARGDANIHVNS